jgi:hypothetical protein
MTDEEPGARAVNAEPWEPLPGMVKLRCQVCGYWFAAPAADTENCPDCAIRLVRRACAAVAGQTSSGHPPASD